MIDRINAYELIDKALSMGRYFTEIMILSRDQELTRFSNSTISQNVSSIDTVVSVKITDGSRESKVTTNINNIDEIGRAIRQAEGNLSFLPETENITPKVKYPQEIVNEGYDRELNSKFNASGRVQLIKSGKELLGDKYSVAGMIELNNSVIAMGNSNGIKRFGRLDYVNFNTLVMHDGGSTGYVQFKTNRASELDVCEEFLKAIGKAKMGLVKHNIEPGSYTVILEPLAVGTLLNNMSETGFSARSVQSGKSFLTGKLGIKTFDEKITIRDNVFDNNTIPLFFDFEGFERKTLNIIEKGIPRELAYDSSSALRDRVENTGHYSGYQNIGGCPENLIMEGGEKNLEEIIKDTKKGILITRLHYVNSVDSRQAVLTGLTRDGTFLVENGEIIGAVNNLRFTESMLKAFNDVAEISSDRRKTPAFMGVNYVPAVKIRDFNFTAKAE